MYLKFIAKWICQTNHGGSKWTYFIQFVIIKCIIMSANNLTCLYVYSMSKKSCPFVCSKLLYKNWQDFFDTHYMQVRIITYVLHWTTRYVEKLKHNIHLANQVAMIVYSAFIGKLFNSIVQIFNNNKC